ncbi:MAG: site-specific integrase, partial [Waterburya sp.]
MIKRKYPPISIHQTLHSKLEVNWQQEYNDEYFCPYCKAGKFQSICRSPVSTCKIVLCCNYCKKRTFLTNQVPAYIYNYLPLIECPNPLCSQLGHDGQKGWIYKFGSKANQCQCRFCKIVFKSNSTYCNSWTGSQIKDELLAFCFDDDKWDLRHFFTNPYQKQLSFQDIYPQWYRGEVKKYFYYLLKSRVFNSDSSIRIKIVQLRQFGKVIKNNRIENKFDINRKTILDFLDNCKNNKNTTINQKLASLREFLGWLELEVFSLIRSRDFLKVSQDDTEWLDEITRKAIKQHLDKIPAPIARHYLV